MRGGRLVGSILLMGVMGVLAACPDEARRRPLGELCDANEACVSGLCVDSLCIEPGVCADGLVDASLAPELAHACVLGIASLSLTTSVDTLATGASTEVHALATFAAPADTAKTYDVTHAVAFELAPAEGVALAPAEGTGFLLTVDDAFVGSRVTISARLLAGDAVRSATTDLTITHASGWGVPEALAQADTPMIPIAVGLDTAGCAHVLWVDGRGARLGTRRRCASGWDAPTVLAAPVGGATVPRAALSVAPSGDAVATWIVAPPDTVNAPALEIWAATHSPAKGWAGLPERLAAPPAGVPVTNLGVACAGPEATLVAWQEMTADAFPVRARRQAHLGWQPAEDVDALGSVLGIPSEGLAVTLTTNGNEAQVVWHDAAATYASASRGAAWEAHVIVIDNLALGTPIGFGDVASTVDGRVLVVGYGGFDNGIGVPEARIDASLYVPGSGWDEERVVEKTNASGPPRAAFTATGTALVWPIATVAAPRVQIALGRWNETDGWSRAIVLDDFPRVGQAAVTPVAIAASLLATWVVYRRVDGDQIERLTATHADMAASATRVPILAPPDGTLGAFVFATGPSGDGLVVAAVTAGSTTTLWAVPLVP